MHQSLFSDDIDKLKVLNNSLKAVSQNIGYCSSADRKFEKSADRKLERFGMLPVPTPRDGNCLFW